MANIVFKIVFKMHRHGTEQNSCTTITPVLSHYTNVTEIFPLIIVNVAPTLDTSDNSKGLYLSIVRFGWLPDKLI